MIDMSQTAWGPETGFFHENTWLQPADLVKNPVSLSECVSPISFPEDLCQIRIIYDPTLKSHSGKTRWH